MGSVESFVVEGDGIVFTVEPKVVKVLFPDTRAEFEYGFHPSWLEGLRNLAPESWVSLASRVVHQPRMIGVHKRILRRFVHSRPDLIPEPIEVVVTPVSEIDPCSHVEVVKEWSGLDEVIFTRSFSAGDQHQLFAVTKTGSLVGCTVTVLMAGREDVDVPCNHGDVVVSCDWFREEEGCGPKVDLRAEPGHLVGHDISPEASAWLRARLGEGGDRVVAEIEFARSLTS